MNMYKEIYVVPKSEQGQIKYGYHLQCKYDVEALKVEETLFSVWGEGRHTFKQRIEFKLSKLDFEKVLKFKDEPFVLIAVDTEDWCYLYGEEYGLSLVEIYVNRIDGIYRIALEGMEMALVNARKLDLVEE